MYVGLRKAKRTTRDLCLEMPMITSASTELSPGTWWHLCRLWCGPRHHLRHLTPLVEYPVHLKCLGLRRIVDLRTFPNFDLHGQSPCVSTNS